MGTPFTFQGTLSFPPDTGVPAEPIPINFAGAYSQLSNQILNLSGSGSKAVSFGSIITPGVTLALVKMDASVNGSPAANPINLQWNGGGSSGQQEISPGGFLVIGSPAPSSGLVSLTVVYTSSALVRVWLLG